MPPLMCRTVMQRHKAEGEESHVTPRGAAEGSGGGIRDE